MNKGIIAITTAVMLAVTLGGCASTQSPGGTASKSTQTADSPQVQAALADGVVDHDEYMEGFRAYQTCLAKAGYTLTVMPDKFAKVQYSVPAEAVSSGADKKCYDYNFYRLDVSWQLAHEDQSEQYLALQACLRAKGLSTNGTEVELENRVKDAGMTIDECLAKAQK